MTPALKAMVEAMGREFLRQSEESESAPVCQFVGETLRVTDVYGGSFDLEKVAHAALAAIPAALEAEIEWQPGENGVYVVRHSDTNVIE